MSTVRYKVYTVEYLKHSIFSDPERFVVEMVQPELKDLLNNGMVTLIEVKEVFTDGMPKYKDVF